MNIPEWENVTTDLLGPTERLRVTGGWIFSRCLWDEDRDRPKSGFSLVFVPDPAGVRASDVVRPDVAADDGGLAEGDES